MKNNSEILTRNSFNIYLNSKANLTIINLVKIIETKKKFHSGFIKSEEFCGK